MADSITEADLPQNLRALWLKALSAAETQNYQYACSLLQAVLKDAPAFLEGRKVLRKTAVQATGGGKKKGGIFSGRGGGLSMLKIHSQAKKDPEGALVALEKELETDPYSESANEMMFDIFMRMNLLDSATYVLETVRRGHPENTKLLHKLAEHYLARDMPTQAAEVYHEIVKHDVTDSAAIKGSKDATARASMQKQKWDQAQNIRDVMKDQTESQELEQSARAGMTRDQLEEKRDRMIERYNENPNHLASAKDLAGIFEQLEDWVNAATFYGWAHQLSAGDVALANKASIMKDKALEFELRQLHEAVEADPGNDALRQEYEQRRAARLAEQVDEARKRVDQNPTDPQLRFELGQALYYSGDHSSAIPHLQQATRNPHIRTRVLLMLGKTFKAKGMYDLSIKQLADALVDLHAMDNVKKEVLYEKGLIHEEIGDKAAALDCFKQIYEVDYSYRDVAKRVEASYSA